MPEDRPAPPGRCPTCGYSLRGLAPSGICPECGVTYSPDTVHLLQPWPPARLIALRLAWPFLGLAVCLCGWMFIAEARVAEAMVSILACLLLLALPINSFAQVAFLLERHMSEYQRKQPMVLVLSGLLYAICAVVFLLLSLGLGTLVH